MSAVCNYTIACVFDSLFVFFYNLREKMVEGVQACPMLSVWVPAGRGWGLHVLPGCGGL